MPVLIGSRKLAELEENKWSDKVFTGDNSKFVAQLTFYARQREMQKSDKLPGRKRTIDSTVGERLFRTTMLSAGKEAMKPQNNNPEGH